MAVGGALFGPTAGTSNRSGSKSLVEFRAGKMTQRGKMVHPDKRKGLVYVHQTDDGLMHFCWKDRQTGAVEDDLIIFPDDCEYKRVPQCKTGRVYLLRFKTSSRRFFFWMQEPKTDRDDEYCRRVNDSLNNPPTPGTGGGGGGGLAGLAGLGGSSGSGGRSGGATPGDGDLQSFLSNMSQQQLMQLFGGQMGAGALLSSLGRRPGSGRSSSRPTPATTTAPQATSTTTVSTTSSTPTTTESQGAIQLSDLQNILSGLQVPSSAAQEAPRGPNVDLSTALGSDAVQWVLGGNSDNLRSLQSLLPVTEGGGADGGAEGGAEKALKATLASPQFQQALSMFSAAVQSGQIAPLMQQFELSEEVVAAARRGDLEAFVKGLEGQGQGQGPDKKKKKKEEGGEDEGGDGEDDDDSMSFE